MRRPLALTCSGILALLCLGAGLPGQSSAPPAFQHVVGHELGERITLHHQMVRYLEHLASVSPRVTVVDQGESWEGRRLLLAVVTAPENHARLAAIQDGARRLADPRAVAAGAVDDLIRSQPAIVWIGGSIHGFELSGSEGVLKLLDHLATREDDATLDVLRHTVVLIDPMLNPDGRDAFAITNQQRSGREPNPAPEDWGNDFTGWEGLTFRTGHYYFDMNRDWFAHTQRETRQRVATLQAWRPQIVIDAHEMGPETEFYFDPPTEPVSPYFPEFSMRWLQRFGEAYRRAFDAGGLDYTTRELYNFFYPGYTTSYGSFLGGVGMLYEQGSSRGLALTRRDGSVRTLAQALDQQYTAAWTAVQLAAREREPLLRELHASYRAAIDDGRRGIRRYVIGPGGDPSLVAELADLLRRNGVEVASVVEPATLAEGRDRSGHAVRGHAVSDGAFVVDAAQPRNRLVRALLEPHVQVPEAFLEEARARLDRAQNPRFYDITAWSLPLLFNVEASSGEGEARLATRPLGDLSPFTPEVPSRDAAYAYILDGRQAGVMAAAYHLRHRDHRVSVALKPTRVADRVVHGGSVIVRVREGGDRVHEDVKELAQAYGLNLSAVDTGAAPDGLPTLAATDVVSLAPPNVALLAEQPIHAYSFGWAWYTLDQQYRIPTTVVRVRSVAGTPLHRYNVLVLPEVTSEQELATALGDAGLDRLRQWVRDGGTLVAIGSGVDFVRERLKLVALRSWYDVRPDVPKGEPRPPAQRIPVPGAIFRGVLEYDSWLSAGYSDDLPLLVNSSRIYLPAEGPPSANRRVAVRYAADAPTRLSGHAWAETMERLPGTVVVYEERVGRGRVIAFAEDPNFRAYWRGANRLFLNAVVLGPNAP